MQTRSSDEKAVRMSVRPSVRLSVCQTRELWQNGRKICSDFYTIRKNIYHSFLRRRMVGGLRSLLPEILGQPAPVGAKSPIFNRYSLVAAVAVTPSKKVQLTLIWSLLRAFQWAQDEHRTLSLSPQRVVKNAVSRIWTISCDNSETVRDRVSVTINH